MHKQWHVSKTELEQT